MLCSCGCGQEIKETDLIKWKLKNGQKNFYIKGHRDLKGTKNPRWKGGTFIDSKGYKFVLAPSHPNARKSGYVSEAHFVISKHLNRSIDTTTEVVHHINGIKLDNRLGNLIVIKRSEHPKIHFTGADSPVWKEKIPKICPTCGKEFVASYGNYKRSKYCSRQCLTKASGKKFNPYTKPEIIQRAKHLEANGFSQTRIASILRIDRHTVGRILSV
jgi:hypothetical protein